MRLRFTFASSAPRRDALRYSTRDSDPARRRREPRRRNSALLAASVRGGGWPEAPGACCLRTRHEPELHVIHEPGAQGAGINASRRRRTLRARIYSYTNALNICLSPEEGTLVLDVDVVRRLLHNRGLEPVRLGGLDRLEELGHRLLLGDGVLAALGVLRVVGPGSGGVRGRDEGGISGRRGECGAVRGGRWVSGRRLGCSLAAEMHRVRLPAPLGGGALAHHGGTKWLGSLASSAVEMQLGVFGHRPRVLTPPRSRMPRLPGRSPLMRWGWGAHHAGLCRRRQHVPFCWPDVVPSEAGSCSGSASPGHDSREVQHGAEEEHGVGVEDEPAAWAGGHNIVSCHPCPSHRAKRVRGERPPSSPPREAELILRLRTLRPGLLLGCDWCAQHRMRSTPCPLRRHGGAAEARSASRQMHFVLQSVRAKRASVGFPARGGVRVSTRGTRSALARVPVTTPSQLRSTHEREDRAFASGRALCLSSKRFSLCCQYQSEFRAATSSSRLTGASGRFELCQDQRVSTSCATNHRQLEAEHNSSLVNGGLHFRQDQRIKHAGPRRPSR